MRFSLSKYLRKLMREEFGGEMSSLLSDSNRQVAYGVEWQKFDYKIRESFLIHCEEQTELLKRIATVLETDMILGKYERG